MVGTPSKFTRHIGRSKSQRGYAYNGNQSIHVRPGGKRIASSLRQAFLYSARQRCHRVANMLQRASRRSLSRVGERPTKIVSRRRPQPSRCIALIRKLRDRNSFRHTFESTARHTQTPRKGYRIMNMPTPGANPAHDNGFHHLSGPPTTEAQTIMPAEQPSSGAYASIHPHSPNPP